MNAADRSLSEAATLMAVPAELAATLAAPGAALGTPGAPTPDAGASRTTVLPRPAPAVAGGGAAGAQWVLERRARYEPQRMLGAGGIGEVSLALDNDIGRPVAVKRLRPGQESEEAVLRFAEEVRTIGQLEHPNIVPIHDVGVDERQQYYFVMKYVEGETLERVIERLAAGDPEYVERYPVERRADICQEIMNALSYAHAQGVIHRDLKPANVMVGKYGEVMVMDWGLAKRIRGEAPALPEPAAAPGAAAGAGGGDRRGLATMQGVLLGTPMYMTPEQARGDNAGVDKRTDVYALGVMMHELFTLRHYLADCEGVEEMLVEIQGPDRSLGDIFGDVSRAQFPNEYNHIIRKAMRKDPADRYASMAAMAAAFRRARAGHFAVQCPCTMVKRPTHALLRMLDARPLLMPALVVLAAVVMLFSVGYTAWDLAAG